MKSNAATQNAQRINAATKALDAYSQAKGQKSWEWQSLRETIVDLVTDMRHLSAKTRVDFQSVVEMSEIHFNEETDEEDEAKEAR